MNAFLSSFAPRVFPSRLARLLPAAAVAAALAPGAARADCNAEFGALMAKRTAQIASLNTSAKGTGGKLDPIAACPKLRTLAAIEGQLADYVQKNQAWCGMPEDLAAKMVSSRTRTAGIAAKACTFAVKLKQAQQQQAAQQAQQAQQQPVVKLPAGPL